MVQRHPLWSLGDLGHLLFLRSLLSQACRLPLSPPHSHPHPGHWHLSPDAASTVQWSPSSSLSSLKSTFR